ncbi:hypothetical protein [Kineococcus sp. NPDC059986]|uniref:zinc finger domain-containing protein n=1 Tax=Kineococcus sp. NPDC059986 TaxID=3155538 RepID=UPI00344F399D
MTSDTIRLSRSMRRKAEHRASQRMKYRYPLEYRKLREAARELYPWGSTNWATRRSTYVYRSLRKNHPDKWAEYWNVAVQQVHTEHGWEDGRKTGSGKKPNPNLPGREVPCPYCGAEIEAPCRRKDGRTAHTHKDRLMLAQKEAA